MGTRAIVLGSVIALAATTPGCITALAAVAGADARVIQSALEADTAILGALTDRAHVACGDGGGDAVLVSAPEVPLWRCMLASGDEQHVRAHSLEGARAACLMGNDVDLTGDGCICVPLP